MAGVGATKLMNPVDDVVVVVIVVQMTRPHTPWTRAPVPAWCWTGRYPDAVVPRDVVLAILVVTRPPALARARAAAHEGCAADCSLRQVAAEGGEVGGAA